MHMAAIAGLIGIRLRHEARTEAVFARSGRDEMAQHDGVIGRGQHIGFMAQIDLVLPGRKLRRRRRRRHVLLDGEFVDVFQKR